MEFMERPFLNDYCQTCKYCWWIEKDEARCRKIKLGMSDEMCAKVIQCPFYQEKGGAE